MACRAQLWMWPRHFYVRFDISICLPTKLVMREKTCSESQNCLVYGLSRKYSGREPELFAKTVLSFSLSSCQYFVDYCAVPNVCRHAQATCIAGGNEVSCTCPSLNKDCSLGINQCSTNPFVCLDDNKECIELHDELPSWNMEVCNPFHSRRTVTVKRSLVNFKRTIKIVLFTSFSRLYNSWSASFFFLVFFCIIFVGPLRKFQEISVTFCMLKEILLIRVSSTADG